MPFSTDAIKMRLVYDREELEWCRKNGPEQAINALAFEIRVAALEALLAQPAAIDEAISKERSRCAEIVSGLRSQWMMQGDRIRREGTYTVRSIWPPFKKVDCVRPRWAQVSDGLRAAARSLDTVLELICDGWTHKEASPPTDTKQTLDDYPGQMA